MKASELIAHLESGGYIARGGPSPDKIEFAYLDSGKLGVSGWGSALGTSADRLTRILQHPDHWVIVPCFPEEDCENWRERAEILKRLATAKLEKLGRWVEDRYGLVWRWTWDEKATGRERGIGP